MQRESRLSRKALGKDEPDFLDREEALLSSSPSWSSFSTSSHSQSHITHLYPPSLQFTHLSPTSSSSPKWAQPLGTSNTRDYQQTLDETEDFPFSTSPGSPRGLLTQANVASSAEDWLPPSFQQLGLTSSGPRSEILEKLKDDLRCISPEEGRKKLEPLLPTIAVLAYECPIQDIRKDFQSLLNFAEEVLQMPRPTHRTRISYFIPNHLIVPVEGADELTKRLFPTIFLQYGRVSHLVRVLGWHPAYLDRYYQTYHFIMRESGPLQLHIRSYIAIMAASQYRCHYLVAHMEQEFLANGGDPTWLKGIYHIPKKMSNLLELNCLLAHQPWLVTKNHIAELVKGADAWSIGQLVHAMVIMSTFRFAAGMVFGSGVAPELDLECPELHVGLPALAEDSAGLPSHRQANETDKIVEVLKGAHNHIDEDTHEGKRTIFENAAADDIAEEEEEENDIKRLREGGDLERYIGPYNRQHIDFNVRSKDYSVFRVQDYSWKDHGYALVSRFYEDAAQLLDDEFGYIYSMTDNRISGHTNVNTAPFRESIWYYVHRIHGLLHEDYDYRNVNTYLNRSLKLFAKKVSCFPQRVTFNDWTNIGIALRPEEKVHVTILAAEAARQAELLYGLHAVMQYMT
jgi:sestrin